MREPTPIQDARQTDSVTGVRITEGNAVDCPQIRDDSGKVHTVSYLSPGVAIGDRVSVSGFFAITTRCRGTVLVVEEESVVSRKWWKFEGGVISG